MLTYTEIQPSHTLLSLCIDRYVHISGNKIVSKQLTPQLGTSLVFDFTQNALYKGNGLKIALIGLHEYSFQLSASSAATDRLIVRFSPCGLSAFLRQPLQETNNQIIDGDALFGKEAFELYNQMGATASINERIQLLEAFLLRRLTIPSALDEVVFTLANQIKQTPEFISFKHIKATIPVSLRQLERKFKRATGTSISHYRRLARFSKAISLLRQQPDWRLTDIGLEAGYFDQPHFISDFKLLTGTNPKRFRFC